MWAALTIALNALVYWPQDVCQERCNIKQKWVASASHPEQGGRHVGSMLLHAHLCPSELHVDSWWWPRIAC